MAKNRKYFKVNDDQVYLIKMIADLTALYMQSMSQGDEIEAKSCSDSLTFWMRKADKERIPEWVQYATMSCAGNWHTYNRDDLWQSLLAKKIII